MLLGCIAGLPLGSQASVLHYDQFGVIFALDQIETPAMSPKGTGFVVGKNIFTNRKGGGFAFRGSYLTQSASITDEDEGFSDYGFSGLPVTEDDVEAESVKIKQEIASYYIQAEFYEPLTRFTDFTFTVGLKDQRYSSTLRVRMPEDDEADEDAAVEPIQAQYDKTSEEYLAYRQIQRAGSYSAYYYEVGLAQSLWSFGNIALGYHFEKGANAKEGYWVKLYSHTDSPVDLTLTYREIGGVTRYQFGIVINY